MKRKQLQTPHDRFFKVMFSKTAVISSFVNTYLFPNTDIGIDFSISMAIKNDTVDGFLNEFRSDLIYRLFDKTNSQFIYLLFEHKSTPDKKTLIQLKHYLNTIENEIPEGEKHEGPILVVIYHGRRKWGIPLAIDLGQSNLTLQKHFSRLEYILFDFSRITDEKILGSPQLRLAIMGLKYVGTRSIIKKINQIIVILKEMADEKEIGEYAEELALYIDAAAPEDLKGNVLEKIKTEIITGENKMSSIKEYFKQEGLKEGFEQGFKEGAEKGFKEGAEKGFKEGAEKGFKQGAEQGFKQGAKQGLKHGTEQGIKQVALNMLKDGESTEKVALYTGLSEEKIASLRKRFNNNANGDVCNP